MAHTPPVALLFATVVLTAPAASAYQLAGAVWDPDPGPSLYRLHPAGSDDISDGSDLEAVRAAFHTWSCAEGSRFRFAEQQDADGVLEGIAEFNLDDGVNTVFWDEDGSSGVQFGEATMAVTMGDGGGNFFRRNADMVFNGIGFTWSTDGSATDVQTVALHEAGMWLGLTISCAELDPEPVDCLDRSAAAMGPIWDGTTPYHELQADDLAGVVALYPQDADDPSTCDGPYRTGEYCGCNDDCAEGLECALQPDGRQLCSKTCNGDDPTCGPGSNCVLGAIPEGEEGPAPGQCLRAISGMAAQPGTACINNGMCGAQDCTNLAATGGVDVCVTGCVEDDDCDDGFVCSGIACLLDPNAQFDVPCTEPDVDAGAGDGDGAGAGCACVSAEGSTTMAGVPLALVLAWVAARRRRAVC
jgi:uncharacterized protein (TIGR03382 family)